MKKVNILIWLTITFLIANSCSKDQKKATGTYSFFVAGHTYGNTHNTLGLHPPFFNDFDSIRAYPHIAFGVLTGDMVLQDSVVNWDSVDREIAKLHMPVYYVPGNHDVYPDDELFKQRYGDPKHGNRTFRSFLFQKDLMILLDANLDNWSITGDQLTFLQHTLNENRGKVNHVFIFVHQLIWWDEHTVFKNIVHNWPPYTPDTTNYWGTLEPMFQNYSVPVYLFAGDLGIFKKTTPYMYYKDNNITYIASGMGSEVNDNYIFVTVHPDREVDFDLIALQGNRHRFGKMEDYIMP